MDKMQGLKQWRSQFLFIMFFLTCGTSKRCLDRNISEDSSLYITKKACIKVSISNEDELQGVDPEGLRILIRDHLAENVFLATEEISPEIVVDVLCRVEYQTRLGMASSAMGCIGIGGILMGATYPAVTYTRNFPIFGAAIVLLAAIIPDNHKMASAQIELAIYDSGGKQIKNYYGYSREARRSIALTELFDFKHSAPVALLNSAITKALTKIVSDIKKDRAIIEGLDER